MFWRDRSLADLRHIDTTVLILPSNSPEEENRLAELLYKHLDHVVNSLAARIHRSAPVL